jgi:hypothetical protein
MNSYLTFIIGFIVGVFFMRFLFFFRVHTMLKSIAETPAPKPEVKLVNLEFVRMKERIYAYNRENNNFLASGDTKQEIVDILNKRFPDTNFKANKLNMKEVGLHDTE